MSQADESFDLLPALDEKPGPARRLPARRAQALVAAALAAAVEPPAERSLVRRGTALAAAAVLLVCLVGAASAAYLWRRPAPRPAPASLSAPAPVSAPAAVPAPAPALGPPGPVAPPRERASHRAPEDLLRLANDRRRERRWQEADGLYQRVLLAQADTGAAYVAQVASAALHLEQLGDARGALRLYRRALASHPGGALSEEARHGIAEAYRSLGDRAGERQALTELLRAHPTSLHRRGAEARLRELATPSP